MSNSQKAPRLLNGESLHMAFFFGDFGEINKGTNNTALNAVLTMHFAHNFDSIIDSITGELSRI